LTLSACRAIRRLLASNAARRFRARARAPATPVKRLAVTRNHDADGEGGEHLDRRPRSRHGGRVDLRRHHEAEAVFPQRIARSGSVLGV